MHPVVWADDGPTVAGSDAATVQDVLDGKVDVDAIRSTGDLDTVAKGRYGPVGPATPAVLWDVLVAGHRAVVFPVFVAPGECFWQRCRAHELMGGGTFLVVVWDDACGSFLFLVPDLSCTVAFDGSDGAEYGKCKCGFHVDFNVINNLVQSLNI